MNALCCLICVGGRYVPVEVDHSVGIPGTGTFLLHQGIQRRLGFTVVLEDDSAMIWRDVKELMVGRVRKTLDWRSTANDGAALSLNLLPAHYIKPSHDERFVEWCSGCSDGVLNASMHGAICDDVVCTLFVCYCCCFIIIIIIIIIIIVITIII